jgi:3-oxoacyl-[acyl-carrier-protein] synthase-3
LAAWFLRVILVAVRQNHSWDDIQPMKYSNVYIDAIGYEIAPVVMSSAEMEERLGDLYAALHLAPGQLEALTGIIERRWWEEGYRLSDGAIAAARRALDASNVTAGQLGCLIYGGVCREYFEPATACRVASAIGVSSDAAVYDVSNACLGVLNGMVEIANRIEIGQIQAGMVVACETAREINDIVIEQMNRNRTMDFFKHSLATLTGGSGAVAVLLANGSISRSSGRKVLGGTQRTAPQFHGLCRWGIESTEPRAQYLFHQFTTTDSAAVLSHGVVLGKETWQSFLQTLGWDVGDVDKVVCHQVGAAHRETILRSLGIPESRDFATYPYLGNMGTVSLPLTAGLAEDRGFLQPGDRVGFLGIGSGLNCMMLGLEW